MAIDLRASTESAAGFKIRWGIEQYFFTAQGTDLDHNLKAEDIAGSGFMTQFENNLAGMVSGDLKISGMASMRRNKVNYLLFQWLARTTPVNAWYCTEGLNALAPMAFQPSTVKEASIKGKMKDSVTFDASLSARGDSNPNGIIMISPNSATQLATTGEGSVDINENATAFGGAAVLHVFAVDGGTAPTVAVKIKQSPDGTTWTDLVTFTTVTATNATGTWVQRVELGSTVSMGAQLKASWTTTGTPTGVQVLCGVARNYDLDA